MDCSVAQAAVLSQKARKVRQAGDRSSAVARNSQRLRRELEETILRDGEVVVEVKEILPLEQAVAVDDPPALNMMRAILGELLADQKFRRLRVRYTTDSRNPLKQRGMLYELTVKKDSPANIKQEFDPQRALRDAQAGIIRLFCVDPGRQKEWRSVKLGAVDAVMIRGRWIPVVFTANGTPVALVKTPLPERKTV